MLAGATQRSDSDPHDMGGDVAEERKREMKALFVGQAALKEHFGIPE
jgi:hypothetical protein